MSAPARADDPRARAADPATRAPGLVRVLGIDPGSVVMGYGIIETDGVRSVHVAHGHVRVKGATFVERLGHIHRSLADLVAEWRPAEAAIEEVFMSKNVMSALKLGQARGAAIGVLTSCTIPVAEYNPRSIKQVVTGRGAAPKAQVQAMVRAMLALGELQGDAADGLAIALCHAHSRMARAPAAARAAAAGEGAPTTSAAAALRALAPRKRSRGRGLRL